MGSSHEREWEDGGCVGGVLSGSDGKIARMGFASWVRTRRKGEAAACFFFFGVGVDCSAEGENRVGRSTVAAWVRECVAVGKKGFK